ncbi:MAG: DinB family protein, partial [Gemmatimonadetes bacterium]|nr:DinB family protein [Gemmatimonadota bacterium]
GDTGYVRDRDAEFAARGVARSEILAEIDVTAREVEETLAGLTDADLAAMYPVAIAGVRFRVDDFLLHLASHLSFHLGQIDYHRRIVTGVSAGADALSIPELATAEPQ